MPVDIYYSSGVCINTVKDKILAILGQWWRCVIT